MSRSVTAVIPAAGRATRLGTAVSGSKEVAEVGGVPVISHYLRRLAAAGIDRALIALRAGKWDIPAALDDDVRHGIEIGYVVLNDSPSPAHSIAPALRFAASDTIALGFPDVIFEPIDAFTRLFDRQAATGADLVLGVFPSSSPERVDMVALDETGRVTDIVIKQPDRGLAYCWTLAVWTPRFTTYLLERLRADHDRHGRHGEFQIGAVMHAGIEDGLHTESVVFSDGEFLDVGTPEDLATARRRMRDAGGLRPAGPGG